MYSFKIKEAEEAVRGYLHRHPDSKIAVKALDGDCAAMMELYERLCGPIEKVLDEGPSDDASFIILEAVNRKYLPAMVKYAQDTMCLGEEYFADGLITLMEAHKFGSKEAMIQLRDDWHNSVKDIDAQRKVGERLNKYEEFVLAFYYHYGIGVEKNEALALNLFKSSAKQGCDEAKKMLPSIQPA